MENENDNVLFSHLQQDGFQSLKLWRRSGPSSPCGSSGVSLGQQVTNGSDTRSLTRFFLSSPWNWNLWRSAQRTLAPWPDPWGAVLLNTMVRSGWEWFLDDYKDGKKGENETEDRLIFTAKKAAVDCRFPFSEIRCFYNLKHLFTSLNVYYCDVNVSQVCYFCIYSDAFFVKFSVKLLTINLWIFSNDTVDNTQWRFFQFMGVRVYLHTCCINTICSSRADQ